MAKYLIHMQNAIFLVYTLILLTSSYMSSYAITSCKYGERGALMAICTNATPNYFRDTPYHFDHLDETLQCINCTLTNLESGTFDISGNQIQILDLRNSKIKYIRVKSFTGLVFLTKLIMSDNLISLITPGAFYGARRIRQIYLDNALTAPLPELAFQELRQLRELYLRNNFLSKLESKTFFGLENLEILDLSFNKLKEINNTLTYLKNLKLVLLNNNEIFRIGSLDFQGTICLLEINLATNLIGSLSFNLSGLNNLRKLDLSNNHLGNHVVNVGTFKNMHNLETLNLALNWFKVIPPKMFQGLYNLRELILSNNIINKFQSGAFSGLPSLRILNVSHNNIETAEITGKLSLHQLHVIDFSNNKISRFDFLRFIQRAPRISNIDLRNNLLPCEKKRKEEEYFKNENIKYKMDLQNCSKLSEKTMKDIYEELKEDISDLENGSSGLMTFKLILLVLVILLVGLLFYSQFFVLNRRRP